MNIQPGYYSIKHDGFVLPARWDGENWHHEKGIHPSEENHSNVIKPLDGMGCPLGCVCTTNVDGSIHVNCS